MKGMIMRIFVFANSIRPFTKPDPRTAVVRYTYVGYRFRDTLN